jgi:DUF917 family protein
LRVTVRDIDALVLGSAVLGSGGGGNPGLGAMLLRQAWETKGLDGVEVIPFDQIDDNSFLISSAGMGSPVIGVEKIPNGEEYAAAFKTLELYLNRTADYISPVEIGGVNSIVPLITASYRALPVADADGEGRAFPELQMTTFNAYGQRASPLSVVDERKNTSIIEAVNNFWAEKIARSVTVTYGGRGYVAIYPMTGSAYRSSAIPSSLSRALTIGEEVIEGIKRKEAEESLINATDGERVFTGKIVDLKRYNVRGFSIGNVSLEGLDEFAGSRLDVTFQNEYLRARLTEPGGRPKVIVQTPDIIAIHDYSAMLPLTTDQLRYGARCKVFRIPVDKKWLTEAGLRTVGPEAFSLDS